MYIDWKHIFLFGLVSSAIATPTVQLDRRAQVPADGVKCTAKTFTAAEINLALAKAKAVQKEYDAKNKVPPYPKYFGNAGGNNQPVFPNYPIGAELYEYPIVTGATAWAPGSSEPGIYRVIMNPKYVYVGITEKTTGGGTVKKC